MKWTLLLLLTSFSANTGDAVVQVPMQTQELCERAAAQLRKDFSLGAQLSSMTGAAATKQEDNLGGVVASCVQNSN